MNSKMMQKIKIIKSAERRQREVMPTTQVDNQTIALRTKRDGDVAAATVAAWVKEFRGRIEDDAKRNFCRLFGMQVRKR